MRQIEDLGCANMKIMQDKSLYTFTSDSVILANFLKIKKGEAAVEIGTGSGVISILACAKNNAGKIYAFEVNRDLADLARKNVKLNNLQQKIQIIDEKVQNFAKFLQKNSINVVFSNPPYMKTTAGNSTLSPRENARHDRLLPMEDLCRCASEMLCFGGRFYVVYSAQRSAELIGCLQKHNLEPKTMFFTDNGRGRVVLVVIEAVKGGKPDVKVLPNLSTNDQSGQFLTKLQTRNFLS